MSKTVNKSSNKPNIPAALMFVFRLVKKEKPMLYLWYFLQWVSEIGTTVLPIILPKYIFEFLMAITQGFRLSLPFLSFSHPNSGQSN